MTEAARWELLFKRDDLTVKEVREVEAAELGAGEVELAVERLALTMNNVTYARWGAIPPLNFWSAFPAPDPVLGRLPVWGFARVSRSNHPGYAEGDRFFGFLPSSSHHVVRPEPASRGFVDTTPGRYFAHPWYQTFQPAGAADHRDDRRALLRPVYPASFHVAGFIAGQAGDDGLTVLITSASSKVAIGIAHRLRGNANVRTIGLTSGEHTGFLTGLGLFDEVTTYDELPAVPAGPVLCVDLAGDAEVLTAIHGKFRAGLAHIALLGWTHGAQPPPELNDPAPELFFTPAVEGATIEAEGEDAFFARYHAAEDEFIDATESWLTVEAGSGPEAVAAVFRSLADGTHPANGFTILTP
ncbi:DUF2855 family protein [Amycolatopsis sp. NPDC051128]|uniref:DUF2855 family protein n=1 Tax=Amycolatopsis sp. NPDC051128 TaxID=3155412 RepID=UPI00342CBB49